jgi:hypothetical protein
VDHLEVAREADRILRSKFGPYLTSWSPNQDNYFFLDPEDPFFLDSVSHSIAAGFVIFGFAKDSKVYINREINSERARHLRTALHEMLHIHLGAADLDLDLANPAWVGVAAQELVGTPNAILELLVDYLAFKLVQKPAGRLGRRMLRLLLELELWYPGRELERICQDDLLHIFTPLGEEWDLDLYRWLKGGSPEAVKRKIEAYYGEGGFGDLLALLVAQTRLTFPDRTKGRFDPELIQIYENLVESLTKKPPRTESPFFSI